MTDRRDNAEIQRERAVAAEAERDRLAAALQTILDGPRKDWLRSVDIAHAALASVRRTPTGDGGQNT